MTTDRPSMVLHVGAPKCGSSALQTALSRQPVLRAPDGTRFRYVVADTRGTGRSGGDPVILTGTALRLVARARAAGYAVTPSIPADPGEAGAYWAALRQACDKVRSRGAVPILSHESWFSRSVDFRRHMLAGMDKPADVVGFVRPPLEWVNSAWWQWGIWGRAEMDRWLDRITSAPGLAQAFEDWAAEPAANLRLLPSKANVIAGFANLYGLPLDTSVRANTRSSAALTGFLVRNRRFRVSPHAPGVEFIVARWCDLPKGPQLWAFDDATVERILPELDQQARRLLALAEDGNGFEADPSWTDQAGSVPQTGRSVLDDTEELALLAAAVRDGAHRASEVARIACPALPEPLATTAPVDRHDLVVARALEALIAADKAARSRQNPLHRVPLRLLPAGLRRLARKSDADSIQVGTKVEVLKGAISSSVPAVPPTAPAEARLPVDLVLLVGAPGSGVDDLAELLERMGIADRRLAPSDLVTSSTADAIREPLGAASDGGAARPVAVLSADGAELAEVARSGALDRFVRTYAWHIQWTDPILGAAALLAHRRGGPAGRSQQAKGAQDIFTVTLPELGRALTDYQARGARDALVLAGLRMGVSRIDSDQLFRHPFALANGIRETLRPGEKGTAAQAPRWRPRMDPRIEFWAGLLRDMIRDQLLLGEGPPT